MDTMIKRLMRFTTNVKLINGNKKAPEINQRLRARKS